MAAKRSITKAWRAKYRRATKGEKGVLLDQLCEISGWSRGYGARTLRCEPKKRTGPETRGRKRVYTAEMMIPMRRVWASLDGACGRRMAAGMADTLDALIRHRELEGVSDELLAQLRKVSAATIDRMLAPDKAEMTLRGRATTKPGTLLKSQIPVRTGTEWDDAAPGFLEIDLVAHCGVTTKGEYCNTLDATDIATGWTELRAVRNKAQMHVFAALRDIEAHLPFPLLGIDSDNGSEFINHEFMRFCEKEKITFTRSRPYNKNDGCHVEQKNWSVVRQNVGYARFDTDEELKVLGSICRLVSTHNNFFMPSAKLTSKTRDGSRVTKTYDRPATPYRRVLASETIPDKVKQQLTERFMTLNPAEMRRRIATLRTTLYRMNLRKNDGQGREVEAPPLEYLYSEATKESFEYLLF